MSIPSVTGGSGSLTSLTGSEETQAMPSEGSGGCHGPSPSSTNGGSVGSADMPPPPPTKEDLVNFLMEQGMTQAEAEAQVEEMMAQGFQPGFQPPPVQNEESAA
jgi:hypothetical protein